MHFLKHQWHLMATAFMFFTRLPFKTYYSQESLNQCNRYFPFVGAVVGVMGASVLYIFSLVLPFQVSVMLSMVTTILVTGAFHEDGFADVCDGFGGGWTKERILEIMKDSRVGAYGAMGIVLLLLTKYLMLVSMPLSMSILALITGHVLSRAATVTTMFRLQYVRDDETSKAKPISKALRKKDLMIALLSGVIPLFFWPNSYYFLIVLPMLGVKYLLERWFVKWIGGYTGDCLGTVQQVTELTVYLSILMVYHWVGF